MGLFDALKMMMGRPKGTMPNPTGIITPSPINPSDAVAAMPPAAPLPPATTPDGSTATTPFGGMPDVQNASATPTPVTDASAPLPMDPALSGGFPGDRGMDGNPGVPPTGAATTPPVLPSEQHDSEENPAVTTPGATPQSPLQ